LSLADQTLDERIIWPAVLEFKRPLILLQQSQQQLLPITPVGWSAGLQGLKQGIARIFAQQHRLQ
jgi:hypothetical protein